MTTYRQNEEGHLVPDDGGPIWRRSNIFRLNLPLTELVRTVSSREDAVFKADPPPRFSRNIHGKARTSPAIDTMFHIKMFHDGRLEPYRGPINVHFGDANSLGLKDEEPGIGWAMTPYVDDAGGLDRELLLSVRLPEDRFDWLWRQIGEFSAANVAVTFRMDAWQTQAERDFGSEAHILSFALLGTTRQSLWNNFTPIYAADFSVSDEKPTVDIGMSKPKQPVEQAQQLLPEPGHPGSPKEIQTALWWIVGLLMILIAVVWNRTG